MYDLKKFSTQSNEECNKAAQKTIDKSRPVTSWDEERSKVVRIYPDGRVEDVDE